MIDIYKNKTLLIGFTSFLTAIAIIMIYKAKTYGKDDSSNAVMDKNRDIYNVKNDLFKSKITVASISDGVSFKDHDSISFNEEKSDGIVGFDRFDPEILKIDGGNFDTLTSDSAKFLTFLDINNKQELRSQSNSSEANKAENDCLVSLENSTLLNRPQIKDSEINLHMRELLSIQSYLAQFYSNFKSLKSDHCVDKFQTVLRFLKNFNHANGYCENFSPSDSGFNQILNIASRKISKFISAGSTFHQLRVKAKIASDDLKAEIEKCLKNNTQLSKEIEGILSFSFYDKTAPKGKTMIAIYNYVQALEDLLKISESKTNLQCSKNTQDTTLCESSFLPDKLNDFTMQTSKRWGQNIITSLPEIRSEKSCSVDNDNVNKLSLDKKPSLPKINPSRRSSRIPEKAPSSRFIATKKQDNNNASLVNSPIQKINKNIF